MIDRKFKQTTCIKEQIIKEYKTKTNSNDINFSFILSFY